MEAGKDVSAISAHLWLEKTAFFKVPRALQDETVELNGRPFEDVGTFNLISFFTLQSLVAAATTNCVLFWATFQSLQALQYHECRVEDLASDINCLPSCVVLMQPETSWMTQN